jgi:hypothetical protein
MNLKKIIREEMDEWDWAREPVLFNMEDLKVGDKIRIHNVGDEEAFLNWLGMYVNLYKRGKYGENIEGIIVTMQVNEGQVDCKGDRIFFPKSHQIEKLSTLSFRDQYRGLDIKYELI